MENGLDVGLSYFIDKDIISYFETDKSKKYFLRKCPKTKYYGLPYRDEIITRENFEKRLIKRATYDWFNKWLKG